MHRWTLALALMGMTSSLWSHERIWTFVYDTDPLPKGFTEIEPWVTYELGRNPGDFYRWRTRLEIEHAFTPLLSVALYLNTSRTFWATDSQIVETSNFDGISLEIFQRFTNPRSGWIGSGGYLEITTTGSSTELEEKLILSRRIGEHINTAFNVVFEQEWEREWEQGVSGLERMTEKEAALYVTGGFSYTTHRLGIGLEGMLHTEYPGRLFPDAGPEHVALFLGPALHYSSPKIWATLSILPQLTSVLDEHSRIMIRTIIGMVL